MDGITVALMCVCAALAVALLCYMVWYDHNHKGKHDLTLEIGGEGPQDDDDEFHRVLVEYTKHYEPEDVRVVWNDRVDRWQIVVTHDRINNSYYGQTRLEALLKADHAARITEA